MFLTLNCIIALSQLLQAVSYLHSNGVVHGNLSPTNCFVSPALWLSLSHFACPFRLPVPVPASHLLLQAGDPESQSLALTLSDVPHVLKVVSLVFPLVSFSY